MNTDNDQKGQYGNEIVENIFSELELQGEISADNQIFAGKAGCGSCG